jgi:hypothetical protein
MKRWALIVAVLYAALLLVLTVPAVLLAFLPLASAKEVFKAYAFWPYWLWLGVMLVSQLALLAVPVRVASLRPVSRGPIWRTLLAGGLMAGGLAGGAFLSIYEFLVRGNFSNTFLWTAVGLAILTWSIWTLIFFRMSRDMEPGDIVSRQCRCLIRGSILELLIAVPTHVVARYRDYCCAGFMTFIGLTMGVSVMLFAYGPAVFFLFAERWKRLHPVRTNPASADQTFNER